MRCHMQPMDAMMPLKTKSIQFMIIFTYVALHALAKMVAFKLKERWGFNPGTYEYMGRLFSNVLIKRFYLSSHTYIFNLSNIFGCQN